MEYFATKLTRYILKKGIIDKSTYEIYQYGFQCFLEISVSTVCSIIIALLFHMLPECLFYFLFFIPMRSYSGGLHLNTYFACFVGSCVILASTLLAVKYFIIPPSISFVLYALSSILIICTGPVNHPNRQVAFQDNHIFKKRTHFTLLLSFIVAIILIVAKNDRYMFLQALIFMFVAITALIGKKLNKYS